MELIVAIIHIYGYGHMFLVIFDFPVKDEIVYV